MSPSNELSKIFELKWEAPPDPVNIVEIVQTTEVFSQEEVLDENIEVFEK